MRFVLELVQICTNLYSEGCEGSSSFPLVKSAVKTFTVGWYLFLQHLFSQVLSPLSGFPPPSISSSCSSSPLPLVSGSKSHVHLGQHSSYSSPTHSTKLDERLLCLSSTGRANSQFNSKEAKSLLNWTPL